MTFASDYTDYLTHDLANEISTSLRSAPWPGLRRLRVESSSEGIRVRGDVTTFFEKQQATHWVRRIAGEVPVLEEIAVISRRLTIKA